MVEDRMARMRALVEKGRQEESEKAEAKEQAERLEAEAKGAEKLQTEQELSGAQEALASVESQLQEAAGMEAEMAGFADEIRAEFQEDLTALDTEADELAQGMKDLELRRQILEGGGVEEVGEEGGGEEGAEEVGEEGAVDAGGSVEAGGAVEVGGEGVEEVEETVHVEAGEEAVSIERGEEASVEVGVDGADIEAVDEPVVEEGVETLEDQPVVEDEESEENKKEAAEKEAAQELKKALENLPYIRSFDVLVKNDGRAGVSVEESLGMRQQDIERLRVAQDSLTEFIGQDTSTLTDAELDKRKDAINQAWQGIKYKLIGGSTVPEMNPGDPSFFEKSTDDLSSGWLAEANGETYRLSQKVDSVDVDFPNLNNEGKSEIKNKLSDLLEQVADKKKEIQQFAADRNNDSNNSLDELRLTDRKYLDNLSKVHQMYLALKYPH